MTASEKAQILKKRMKKRLENFRNTVQAVWKMLPTAARVLIILFVLVCLAILILSSERELLFWLCGFSMLGTLLAGWVIYRLLFRGPK